MHIKTPEEVEIMAEGGALLAGVRDALKDSVKVGMSALEIEVLANELIKKTGGEPSFKRVPGYSWATCVNVNEGIVHGIPKKDVVFAKGDVVSVDVGLFFKGFHTDTSFTVGLDVDSETKRFLDSGRRALDKAITQAVIGNHILDISVQMQKVENDGYSVVRSLVGHGVGRELHESPQVPCYDFGRTMPNPELVEGLVIAIEIMYAQGSPEIIHAQDKWTIETRDGKLSALYEETVAITKNGPLVLTSLKK